MAGRKQPCPKDGGTQAAMTQLGTSACAFHRTSSVKLARSVLCQPVARYPKAEQLRLPSGVLVYTEQASGIIARDADLAVTFGVEVMPVLVVLGGWGLVGVAPTCGGGRMRILIVPPEPLQARCAS